MAAPCYNPVHIVMSHGPFTFRTFIFSSLFIMLLCACAQSPARAVSAQVKMFCKNTCLYDMRENCFEICIKENTEQEEVVEETREKLNIPLIGTDAKRGQAITIDDQLFFPIGLMGVTEWDMEQARGAGFNLVHSYTTCCDKPEPEMLEHFLETAQENNLMAFLTPFYPQEQLTDAGEEERRLLSRFIQRRADFPSLLFWLSFDEPDAKGADPEFCGRVKRFVDEVDPHHPQAMTLSLPEKYMDYVPQTGWLIAMPAPLPFFPIEMVRDHVRNLRAAAAGKRPVLATIQTFDSKPYWPLYRGDYEPTEEEMYNMAHQAVVNGANGVIFWALDTGRENIRYTPSRWAALKRIASDLDEHKHIFLLPDSSRTIGVGPSDATVDVMIKEDDTDYYLLIVNYRKMHIELTLDLSRLDIGEVHVMPHYLHPDLYVTQPESSLEETYELESWYDYQEDGLRNRLRKYDFQNNLLTFEVLPIDVWWFRIEKPELATTGPR